MDCLLCERANGMVRVTLNAPPGNPLSRRLVDALWAALDAVTADPTVSVLHIRGVGRCFSAGADLEEMQEAFSAKDGIEAQVGFVRRLQQLFARIEALDAVSIAELGGHAMGGGLELALACDLRLAAEGIRLGLPEVSLGLVPGAGGTQRLTRLCGAALAKRLILGAERLDAATAAAMGIVHWVVPAADLEQEARGTAERLAALPRSALAAAKGCIALADDEVAGYAAELDATRRLMGEQETRGRVATFLARGRRRRDTDHATKGVAKP